MSGKALAQVSKILSRCHRIDPARQVAPGQMQRRRQIIEFGCDRKQRLIMALAELAMLPQQLDTLGTAEQAKRQ